MASPEFRMTNCGHSLVSNEEPYFKLGISVSNLKIVSFNMHGYRQGITFLDSMLNNSDVDVVFIQEHWLSNYQLLKLTNFHDNYVGFATSSMEDRLSNDVLFGRPFGGMATLVKKTLVNQVTCVLEEERCIILRLGDYLLTNVYLPSHKTDDVNGRPGRSSLISLLESIAGIFIRYSNYTLVMGGDYNCSVNKNVSGKSVFDFKVLEEFQNKFNLYNVIDYVDCSINFTYLHESLNQRSHIDFFLFLIICLTRLLTITS